MANQPVERNRLDEAVSPYLRDHADNPVHWQPWDEAALRSAREHDVPIFLSIGYAACHWCHVMADESFDDETVADVLNHHFVPIKVDREERPDLDRFYQAAYQATSRGGGWPLSAWLTPDGRPFQLATYLPPTPSRGLPGLLDVLESISTAWRTDRSTIEARADEITAATREDRERIDESVKVDTAGALEAVAGDLLRIVDFEHGGFDSAGPKFPQVPRLEVLRRAWVITEREAYRSALLDTLDAMASGGLHDHVGGGFHRYVTDPEWTVPHFEKMAYDNAALLGLYADAAMRFDDDYYATVAHRTAAFVARELALPAGGIACSLDADTDGEEGATYVWTPALVADAIDDETTRQLLIDRFGLAGPAEVAGGRVPRLTMEIGELATAHGLEPAAVRRRLDLGVAQLHEARRAREQPRRDDKAIAAWNGLAISGFTRAGTALGSDALLDEASTIVGFVDGELLRDGRLWRRYRSGEVDIPGFLDDYGAIAAGAFDLASATGDDRALEVGIRTSRGMLDRFWDGTNGVLRYADPDVIGAPGDPLDARDRSLPSPVALAVEALTSAAGFVDDDRVATAIEWAETAHGRSLSAGGVDQAGLALAIDRWHHGPPSVTVAGGSLDGDQRRQLANRLRRPVVTDRPDDPAAVATRIGLDAMPPLWRDRQPDGDGVTLYPCRGRVCGPAMASTAEAITWLSASDPPSEDRLAK